MPSRSVVQSGYRVTRHTTPAGVVLVALPLAHERSMLDAASALWDRWIGDVAACLWLEPLRWERGGRGPLVRVRLERRDDGQIRASRWRLLTPAQAEIETGLPFATSRGSGPLEG